MKCKNCGANYRSRELACPYCGSANPKGQLWQRQRESAQEEYAQLEASEGKNLRLQAAHKAVNRVLLFEGIALAVFLLGVFLWFMLGDAALRVQRGVKKQQLTEQMQQLYSEQKLDELYLLMQRYELFGEENYEYSQAALLHYGYRRFDIARCEFFSALQAGQQADEYLCWSLVNSMNDVLNPYIPAYDRLTENNALLQQQYAADVLGFAQGWLALSREETALLYGDWLTTEQEQQLQRAIEEVAA